MIEQADQSPLSFSSRAASDRSRLGFLRGGELFVLGPAAVWGFYPATAARWGLMILMGFALVFGGKWWTWRRANTEGVSAFRQVVYLFLWTGMDAPAFLRRPAGDAVTAREVGILLFQVGFGIGLLVGIAPRVYPAHPTIAGAIGLAGLLSLLLFAFAGTLSAVWRTVGWEARPLMNFPLTATSLGRFWGDRWNTAFRDLGHTVLFRPITRQWGPRNGLIAVFLFSGVVHELLISVPAGAAYGCPTLFFLLQPIGMKLQRSGFASRNGWTEGLRGWIFTVCWLIGPVLLLFPPVFLREVMGPLIESVGVW